MRNIQNVFNLESVGTFWLHDASDHNVITMSSLGKRSFVPSDRDWGLPAEYLSQLLRTLWELDVAQFDNPNLSVFIDESAVGNETFQ